MSRKIAQNLNDTIDSRKTDITQEWFVAESYHLPVESHF